MLPNQIEKYRNSSRTFRSSEVIEAYLKVRDRLLNAWQSSLSPDGEGREELYRQLKGIDAVMDQLFTDWSE